MDNSRRFPIGFWNYVPIAMRNCSRENSSLVLKYDLAPGQMELYHVA
ncbi:hypothetical protein ACFLSJ_01320 [Verrucomicrobiota bacterium]